MSRDTAMMEILGSILSRLVNVALGIVISILAFVWLVEHTTLHMALDAVLAILIGVADTFIIRFVFKMVMHLVSLFR